MASEGKQCLRFDVHQRKRERKEKNPTIKTRCIGWDEEVAPPTAQNSLFDMN